MAGVVDLTAQFCGPRACYPVIGGVLVHKDNNHLGQLFAQTLGPFMAARRRSPPRPPADPLARLVAVNVASLELDLEVFTGPFDLLLTLVLREEIELAEVELADVVLAYLDHLEARGELDLEAATEFLVLIAALLELKSRLLLDADDDELLDFEPGEAAEELLARLLEARRYRQAAEHLEDLLAGAGRRALPRRAAAAGPAPRRPTTTPAPSTRPTSSAPRSAACCGCPPPIDLRHLNVPRVSVAERLSHLRGAAAPRRDAASTRRSAGPTA